MLFDLLIIITCLFTSILHTLTVTGFSRTVTYVNHIYKAHGYNIYDRKSKISRFGKKIEDEVRLNFELTTEELTH